MQDPYQKGSDADWLQHSNEELAQLVKKRGRQILWLKFLNILLIFLLGWVGYKYAQKNPLNELWKF